MSDASQKWYEALPKRWQRQASKRLKQRQAPSSVVQGAGLLMRLMQRDNEGLSEDQILAEVHKNPMFYASVTLLASQVASSDIFVSVDGQRDDDHPLNELLDNPNRFHTRYTFLWLITAYLLTAGTAYIFRLESGALLPVAPTKITHRGGSSYQVRLGNRTYTDVTLGRNLTKLRLPNLVEPYLSGSGYGAVLAGELDIASAAEDHEAAVLHNNARPDAIINFKGMKDTALRATKEQWDAAHQGPANSGKTAFNNAEKMDVKTLNTSFNDLGFLDLRRYSADVVRQCLGIPPELVGQLENSNRATIEAAFFVFSKTKLDPTMAHIVSALNKDLLPLVDDARNARLDYADVVPEDKQFKKELMESFPQAFTINEVRRLAGYDAVDAGDMALEGDQTLQSQRRRPSEVTEVTVEPTPRDALAALNDDLMVRDLFNDLTSSHDNAS